MKTRAEHLFWFPVHHEGEAVEEQDSLCCDVQEERKGTWDGGRVRIPAPASDLCAPAFYHPLMALHYEPIKGIIQGLAL